VPFNVPLAEPALANMKKQLNSAVTAAPAVVSAIRDGSARSGMPFNVMLASAQMESGLDPNAQAPTSSATGLFQFIDQTWLDAIRQYGPQHGLCAEAASVVRRNGALTVDDPATRQRILDLRKNPAVASALAGDHLRGVSNRIAITLGHPPDAAEIYLGHLLGPGGASQILQAVRTTPNQSASDLLPAAASANPTLFSSPGGTPYTVTQFMDHLRDRVSRAYASVGAVMPQGPINLGSPPSTAPSTAGPIGTGIFRTPGSADPSGIGASGWGSASSRNSRPAFERQLMATMAKVFTHMDLTNHGGRRTLSHGKTQQGLPSGILEALKSGGVSTTG
jgi:hypothetical protein